MGEEKLKIQLVLELWVKVVLSTSPIDCEYSTQSCNGNALVVVGTNGRIECSTVPVCHEKMKRKEIGKRKIIGSLRQEHIEHRQ